MGFSRQAIVGDRVRRSPLRLKLGELGCGRRWAEGVNKLSARLVAEMFTIWAKKIA